MNVASSSRGALGGLKRRFYSSASQASAGPSTSHPRIAPLPHLSVLEVSGPDAQKFLKGLSCKDVDKMGGGYSGFLNASGRVLHTTFIIPLNSSGGRPPTYLITHESPADHPAPLAQLLPPFRLRSKVRIRDVSDEWDVYAAWGSAIAQTGPEEVWKLGSLGAAERQWTWANGMADLGLAEGEVGCWDLRAGFGPQGMGRRVLVPKGKPPSVGNAHDPTSAQEWHLHRLLLGVPEGPGEVVPGQALPLESCMDIHGGVDFRKGCYLGQELTVRTYHTGATRKRILPLRLFPLDSPGPLSSLQAYPSDLATSPLAPGTAEGAEIIYHPPPGAALKKPRPAGKILSTHAVHTSVGLGLVRVEMADRVWWTPPLDSGDSISEWAQGARGRLIAEVGGVEMGVYIGQGEAYAASLRAAEIKAAEAESRETHAHA